jgi:hypothetical protein
MKSYPCNKGCGTQITFSEDATTDTGKKIPLDADTMRPHQCPNSTYNQDKHFVKEVGEGKYNRPTATQSQQQGSQASIDSRQEFYRQRDEKYEEKFATHMGKLDAIIAQLHRLVEILGGKTANE